MRKRETTQRYKTQLGLTVKKMSQFFNYNYFFEKENGQLRKINLETNRVEDISFGFIFKDEVAIPYLKVNKKLRLFSRMEKTRVEKKLNDIFKRFLMEIDTTVSPMHIPTIFKQTVER